MKVLAIYTGGTIGMLPDPDSGVLRVVPLEKLIDYMPWGKLLAARQTSVELAENIHLQIDWSELAEPIDSANLTTDHWQQMVSVIADNAVSYDGFILLHGTDSMAYTASALSFALAGFNKPVVLTGAQQPLLGNDSDAPANLMAAYRSVCLQLPEVTIAFGGCLFRGNRTRKVHTSDVLAFASPNYPVLAHLNEQTTCNRSYWLTPSTQFATPKGRLSSRVANVFFTPGMSLDVIVQLLSSDAVDGYILHGLGSGNLPTHTTLHRVLHAATQQGKYLLAITQCYQGVTHPATYTTGATLRECGVLDGGDMTPEAATTKMMWALANLNSAEIAEFLDNNQCGERRA